MQRLVGMQAVDAVCLAASGTKWVADGVKQLAMARCGSKPAKARTIFAAMGSSGYSTSVKHSQPMGVPSIQGKVYVQHTFYKGTGALSLRPLKPTFEHIEQGVKVGREGSMFFEFSPGIGPKQYDWNRKQIIALAPAELGKLLELAPSESAEFVHDPNMGKVDAGKVIKTLRIEPMQDRTGYFFNFNLVNKLTFSEDRQVVPITKAEFAVMRSLMNYMIPHLLGWNAYVDPSLLNETSFRSESSTVVSVDEWDK